MKIFNFLRVNKNNNDIAIIDSERKCTYKELYEYCSKLNNEVNKNARICLIMENSIELIISIYSMLKKNRSILILNHNSKLAEINKAIKFIDIDIIITDKKSKKIIMSQNQYYFKNILINGFEFYLYIIKRNTRKSKKGDIYFLTSGSTHNYKVVTLTQRNIIYNALSIIESLNYTSSDNSLIISSLSHISSFTSQMIVHLIVRGTVTILKQPFVLQDFYTNLSNNSVTNFTCSPTILEIICRNYKDFYFKTVKKICFGSAPTSFNKIKDFTKIFKSVDLIHMYGQTEASPRISHCFLNKVKESQLKSVGKPLKGIRVKILDDNGNECRKFHPGEIMVKGKNVMKGYFNNKQLTALFFKKNWLKTGDIGFIDNDGLLYVIGRKKNVIIVGGENVYPEEVEECLLNIKQIEKAYVYGIEHDYLGEIIVADIVVNSEITEREIKENCYKNLCSYKIPMKINFVTKIEETSNYKVVRKNVEK